MTPHSYYSQRKGTNPNAKGLPLRDLLDLFVRVYQQLRVDGYFDEAFGFTCVDAGDISGQVKDIDLQIVLDVRKRELWPIETQFNRYSEDDFFDVIEFLFQHVSKPIDGYMHGYGGCGMHWEVFDREAGQLHFRDKMNTVLSHYAKRFELSPEGEVLHKPEAGFEPIFGADITTSDSKITSRIHSAVLKYRRHGSTLDDRRAAVRDLADVLEYLRPKVQELLTSNDEKDLFNIANNFGIRHHNDKQKNNYDRSLWLSWMFYYYLATVHVVLRKIRHDG